jgi:alcohol dehydrogenase
MEAVWNRRHTALSDAMASQAITMIRVGLFNVLRNSNDLAARRHMQTASTIAGLAMGTTQTALAHSISYPFTSRFGVPHGLACSFTLGEIARYNMETDAKRLEPIASGMSCEIEEIPAQLDNWFDKLGVPELVLNYITPSVTDDLDDNLITRTRAANNIREVDGSKAREIARLALDRLNKSASDKLLKVSA